MIMKVNSMDNRIMKPKYWYPKQKSIYAACQREKTNDAFEHDTFWFF